jgi:pimeloyl-ACP methyl ester carboxylesterase
MRMTIRLLAIAVLAATLHAAPVAPAKFAPYQFKANDGTVVDAEMGELRVPQNRTQPDSRTITIRFVRFKSTSPNPGPPIVYLAGGPGGAGTGAATGTRFPMFMALREFGDVIAYDARGVHKSEPDAQCTEEAHIALDQPYDRAKAGAVLADAARRCAARLRKAGTDPGALNTRESAADLNDLRQALGAKKLILWGISYGAHLGIATLRYHPEAIDRVILAGIEGPDDTYKLPSDQQLLLEEIARLAYHDGKSYDLLGSINRLLNELEARPKSVTLTHPETGKNMTVTIGKLDLQRQIADMLFAPDTYAGLPDFIARLEQGDWTALALIAGADRFASMSSMMSIAMDCASGISPARKQRIAEEAKWTLLGDAIGIPFPEICEGLNIPDLGDDFRAPLRSDVPALLISGTLDGRTRPRQAEELRRTMPNATTLIIEGAGHSDPLFLSSPKILETMKAFLRGEPIRERYITLPPITFLPLRTIVTLSDDILTRYTGTYRVNEKEKLKVIKAGPVLYLIPNGSSPLAIRPSSETEFFNEGMASSFLFEVAEGRVVALSFGDRRAVRE